ncbi:MAG: LysM peptidoglycan-binding domain-containing protein [Acetatifactor sp.]|nr:LysM peptidoglycan-binding domain-containing protein [Acetatifactor sp.]
MQPGDNLWRIAGKVYGKNERWREIYEANRNLLSNPERIYAKQVLVIP